MWIKVTFFLSTLTLIVGVPVRNKPLPITQESIDGLKYLLKLRQMHLQEQLQQPQEFLFSYRIPTQEELSIQVDPEAAALQQMLPPIESNEPNYYAMKPRKGSKKYQPNQKQIHLRNPPQSPIVVEDDDSVRQDYPFEDVNYDLGEQFYLPEARNPDAVVVESADYVQPAQPKELNTGETYSAIRRKTETQEGAGDRVEFQMHGHAGPKSYKFGYDTGKGKNRQFRFEEVDNEGKLKGHYGYIDKRGKMHIVKYTSSPEEGFKAEKAS